MNKRYIALFACLLCAALLLGGCGLRRSSEPAATQAPIPEVNVVTAAPDQEIEVIAELQRQHA